jgi:hypothetical protein
MRSLAWINGYVYFIRPVGMDGPIKIGWSRVPEARLKELATWSPLPLEVAAATPGPGTLETKLQRLFADHHSHGEWFHCCDEMRAGIDALNAGASVEEAFDLDAAELKARHWRCRSHLNLQGEAAQ